MNTLLNLAKQLGECLLQKGLYLVTAESCTGGQIAEAITAIAGSSRYLERGFVTYSNEAKQELLSVPADIIGKYGAVSKQTVCAMAEGAIKHSHAQVSIAVSGIAGPEGGTQDKPVGTVWLAWSLIDLLDETKMNTTAKCYHFSGDRISIRTQATEAALQGMIELLL